MEKVGGCTIEFTIPLAFPSVNALHQIIWSQRKVELKPEIRKWKNDAAYFIPRAAWASDTSLICVDLIFHYPFYYANGKFRLFDTHNCVKPLIDIVAEKQGWDDKRAKSGSWQSVDDAEWKVLVVMQEVPHGPATT